MSMIELATACQAKAFLSSFSRLELIFEKI